MVSGIKNIANTNVYANYQSNKTGNSSNSVPFGTYYSAPQTKANDGEFSISEAGKNFVKGLVSPITNLLSSPKNFIIGVGMIGASTVAVAATGGAAAPILVAAGVGMGAIQVAKGIYGIASAENGDEAEKAFYDIGGATSSIGLSVAGAKSSLKSANIETENINALAAVKKCFTSSKSLGKECFDVFKSGHYKSNIHDFIAILKQPAYYRKAAGESFKKDQERFDAAVHALKEILPEKYHQYLKVRNKSEVSRYFRMIRERTPEIDKAIKDIQTNKSFSAQVKQQKITELLQDLVPDKYGARLTLDDISPESMDELISALFKSVKNQDAKIIEIENYRGVNPNYKSKNTAYFTKDQAESLHQLSMDDIEVFKNADKHSGYTATQLKVKLKNGEVFELQIRGKEIDKVADWEHIPYDARQGKDIAKANNQVGILLSKVKTAIKNLSEKDYADYQKYIYDNYIYAQAKEFHNTGAAPKLPEGMDSALSAENLEILSTKMSTYTAGKIKSPEDFIAQMPLIASIEGLSKKD